MRIGISILLIALSGMLFAQKVKVGIVNRDSVMSSIPGYKSSYDSVVYYREKAQQQIADMEQNLKKKRHEIDSCKEKDSPLIHQLRTMQAQQLEANLADYAVLSEEELQVLSLRLQPFEFAVEQAEIKMVDKYHCAIESKFMNDNREPIYLTNEVIVLVKENKTAQADRKHIGYVNKDSLLSAVYPEYKKSKATFENDIRLLTDTAEQIQHQYEELVRAIDASKGESSPAVARKQQEELDSLEKRYELYVDQTTNRILLRDSVDCAPYNAKYDKAWADMMKQGEVFYIYDSKDAMLAWKAEEVDLINLNRDFATKLE